MERSLRTEEHTAALMDEVYIDLIKPSSSLTHKANDAPKRVRSVHNNDKLTDTDIDYQFSHHRPPHQDVVHVPLVDSSLSYL